MAGDAGSVTRSGGALKCFKIIAFASILLRLTVDSTPCRAGSYPDRIDRECVSAGLGRKAYAVGSKLCIDGYIDQGMLDELNALGSLEKLRTATLRSPGGDVYAALEIAKKILSLHLTTIVSDYCVSSCANYLFIAGANRTILPGALLGFHGAPPRTFEAFKEAASDNIQMFLDEYNRDHEPKRNLEDELKVAWEKISLMLAEQAAIYRARSVSIDLLYDFRARARRVIDRYPGRERPLELIWVPKRQDLRSYGVSVVSYPVDDADILQSIMKESGYSPILFN